MNESPVGSFARRAIAWLILIAIAVVALKVVVGIVTGLVVTLFWVAALGVLVVGVLWALRRV
jgi:flagellar biosynthesis protein FliQ